MGALAPRPCSRRRLHGDAAFYVVNRQINYTNVCVNGCTFCAFRRDEDSEPGAFRLSKEDILERLRAARQGSLHLDELHIVGGCHPKLRLGWFEDVLRTVRNGCPATCRDEEGARPSRPWKSSISPGWRASAAWKCSSASRPSVWS